MADTVVTRILKADATQRRALILATNFSDGTGETGVAKTDKSTLAGGIPSELLRIYAIQWQIRAGALRLLFDHTTDDDVLLLSAEGIMDFEKMGGYLIDPNSAGDNGNLLFTTVDFASKSHYSVLMKLGW